MEILSRQHISPTEVLNRLAAVAEDELTRQQQGTLEHLRKHVPVQDEDTVDELVEELQELDAFTDDQILKIISVLPRTEQEVRTLFSKERIKLEDADVEDVVSFSQSVQQH